MNKIYKSLLAAAVILPAAALTGCIEETFPTGAVVSQGQVEEVPTSADSYAQGMPAYMNVVGILPGDLRHTDFGYPAIMYIRDTMTGDKPVISDGYDHFNYWRDNTLQGPEYIFSQFTWWYFYKLIQTTNLTIGVIDKATEDKHLQALLGQAYAYRAMAYLDAARMYEYLPTDGTSAVNSSGNNVTGLTVSIVTDDINEELARNNPRVPHAEMFDFIMEDLTKAEQLITAEARSSKVMPDLGCVYGLMARAYMWNLDYPKAREYARKAIDASGCTPLTPDEWTDTTTGFNDLSSHAWMWGMQFVAEDNAVRTGIVNYTSWASNEYTAGYAAAGPYQMIDANLYNSISNDDCRKLCFVAPKGHPLEGKEKWINKNNMMTAEGVKINLPAYSSLKIRPGQGNMTDNQVACAVGVPIMRVEEMYFIEAESAAHSNPAEGKQLMESFIKQYRCPTFSILGSTEDQVVNEIITQKRIEFFLEGINFFDVKRLDMPVTRNYAGTNFYASCAFNTKGRPAWMNLCIVRQEENGNPAYKGWNNPDPSDCYKETDEGAEGEEGEEGEE